MTVTDAFAAAVCQAPPSAKIDKMSSRDYAMHTVADLWTREISKEPRYEILLSSGPNRRSDINSDEGDQQPSQASTPMTLEDAVLMHSIKSTDQRDSQGCRVRRVCHIKANDNCKKGCTLECTHPTCIEKISGSRNKFGAKKGTFICDNPACQMKHWKDVVELATS